jgi:hypothetical protein
MLQFPSPHWAAEHATPGDWSKGRSKANRRTVILIDRDLGLGIRAQGLRIIHVLVPQRPARARQTRRQPEGVGATITLMSRGNDRKRGSIFTEIGMPGRVSLARGF